MARYTARWLEISLKAIAALPEVAQRQVGVRVTGLLEEPEGPPQAYDPPTDQWTTVHGDGARLILYAVVDLASPAQVGHALGDQRLAFSASVRRGAWL